VVERGGLENRCSGNPATEGSNPSPSAAVPTCLVVRPTGRVRSSLTEPAAALKQGDEGVPVAWIVFEPEVAPALAEPGPGDEVPVLRWLDRADRTVLRVHPRDDPARRESGVFATRSPRAVDRLERAGVQAQTVEARAPDRVQADRAGPVKPAL
jgi:tRNA (Thr-GGU) A37 N-methylase